MQPTLIYLNHIRAPKASQVSSRIIGYLAQSISTRGWTYPIVLNQRYEIISGSIYYLAAKSIHLELVPVVWLNQ